MNKNQSHDQSRRSFLSNGIKSAAVLPLISSPLLSSFTSDKLLVKKEGNSPLKILILGGTSFLGPHQIAYALKRGHSITTFTRGKTKPRIYSELFDDVEQLVGDRENNLEALKNRTWDAVIDNSGRKTSWTRATAELLKDNCGFYSYVSSVSAYYPYYKKNLVETDKVLLEIPKNVEEGEQYLYDYGVMKAQSELEAEKIFGKERTAVVRPTFMMGPADRTDRFMYFPLQLSKGGEVIVPGKWNDRVQFIDVRDIAEWMIRMIENKISGTHNGSGPASESFISSYVYGAHAAFNSKVDYINIDDYDFLKEHNLRFQAPWILEEGKFAGMLGAKNDKAIKNGLTFRPLADTIKDVYQWWHSDAVGAERKQKFEDAENELHNRQNEIIRAWQSFEK